MFGPNISGSGTCEDTKKGTGAFAYVKSGEQHDIVSNSWYPKEAVNFDAQKCSAIYSGTKLVPAAIKSLPCIHV